MHLPKSNPIESLDTDLAYQKAILGSVSRTFALTIPLLPPVIETVVGNTYLLCRIVDTIEDAADLNPETKQALSKFFLDAVLEKSPVESFVAPCLAALKNYGNQDEFEEYCYVVAGVVGELLTTIFSNHSADFSKQIKGHEALAIAFGQALQMTNILKDSPEDEARGVSWKPAGMSQSELLKIAYQKLQDSMQYILLIPKKDAGVRRFCFLAFGLAVLTLSKIANRKQFNHKDELKLSRKSVMTFYTFTQFAVRSNILMKLFFTAWSRSLSKDA